MNKAFELILERLDEVERRLLNESGDIGCTLGITNMSEYSKSIVQDVAEEYQITNGDRIRSMSDEELAEFIRELNESCLSGAGMVDCSKNEDCIDCKGVVLEWLQSLAE